ncbi:SET and MYND domain-containing protein 4-like [Copidosoma floridanum]|uniref:SET and MYND domain-containing protein 4-like n=1 Tax=Copidosoma floridanum TaxID=29053 RepID=UPI000C6FB99F|nr:SET and MYND domain-containing protein 4-like [Copidosoma floridanum]
MPIFKSHRIFQTALFCYEMRSRVPFNIYKVKTCRNVTGHKQETVTYESRISSLVEIRDTDLSGKEAVASRVINPGDVLLADYPIASFLIPQFFESHCQYCLKRFQIGYSCPKCSIVSFCSYSCRIRGIKSFHNYECKILPALIVISHTIHLTFLLTFNSVEVSASTKA